MAESCSTDFLIGFYLAFIIFLSILFFYFCKTKRILDEHLKASSGFIRKIREQDRLSRQRWLKKSGAKL